MKCCCCVSLNVVVALQMVDRLDEGLIPPSCGASTYTLLHDLVARAIFRTHVEGKLKAEIIQDPARFVGAVLVVVVLDDGMSSHVAERGCVCSAGSRHMSDVIGSA